MVNRALLLISGLATVVKDHLRRDAGLLRRRAERRPGIAGADLLIASDYRYDRTILDRFIPYDQRRYYFHTLSDGRTDDSGHLERQGAKRRELGRAARAGAQGRRLRRLPELPRLLEPTRQRDAHLRLHRQAGLPPRADRSTTRRSSGSPSRASTVTGRASRYRSSSRTPAATRSGRRTWRPTSSARSAGALESRKKARRWATGG